MMNIKIFENTQDNTFRFEIANGKNVILAKKGLPDKDKCLVEINKTLRALLVNDMINVSSTTGGFSFQAYNTTSRTFKSLEQASDAIAFLKEEGWKREGKFEVEFESRKSEVISKKRIGTINDGYDFRQVSKTKKQGFELLDKEKERLFYFHLNDAEGKPMLYSRAFDGKRQRIKAAQRSIDLVKDKKVPIKIVPFRGGFMFIIKDLEGFEIARSKTFKTKQAAEAGIKYLKSETKGKTKLFKLPKKKKKPLKLPKEKFLLKQVAPKGNIGFEAFRNKTNKAHYFHYHDAKGKTLLVSRAYDSRKKRNVAIQSIIGLSQNKERYVMKEKGDKHYFSLVTDKGKAVARSRFFDSKRDMILGMKHFLNKASSYSEQKNTVTSNQLEKIPMVVKTIGKAKMPEPETPSAAPDNSGKKANEKSNNNRVHPKENAPQREKKPAKGKAPINKNSATNSSRDISTNKAASPNAKPPKKPSVDNRPNQRSSKKPPLKEVNPPRRSTTKVEQRKPLQSRPIAQQQIDVEQGTSSFRGWLLPLILLLLAAISYFLWKSCGGIVDKETPAVVEEVVPQKNVKPVKEVPVKKIPTLLGPTGKELGLTEGSLADKIANFLSLPESVFPETFLLDQVHFDTNSDVLKTAAAPQLDRVVKILKAYPTVQIQINGHTDNVGNAQKNLELSSDRAIKVKKYLIDNGIQEGKIATKGFGSSKPLSSNQTESGKYKNRRSEVVLLRR